VSEVGTFKAKNTEEWISCDWSRVEGLLAQDGRTVPMRKLEGLTDVKVTVEAVIEEMEGE
jgi:hypothetical protein